MYDKYSFSLTGGDAQSSPIARTADEMGNCFAKNDQVGSMRHRGKAFKKQKKKREKMAGRDGANQKNQNGDAAGRLSGQYSAHNMVPQHLT